MSTGDNPVTKFGRDTLNRLRTFTESSLDKLDKRGLAPRHSNPYSTHIPVLIALGQLLPVRSVLEFGSGTYSTLQFLNRDVFPSLTAIESFENDQEWCSVIRSKTDDPRLSLNYVPGDVHTVVSECDLSRFDLIFVDDSRSLEMRSRTISEIARRRREVTGVVAIHDFELQGYRRAAAPFAHRVRFRAFHPEVGLLWTSSRFRASEFKRAADAIQSHAATLGPEDVEGWLRALHGLNR